MTPTAADYTNAALGGYTLAVLTTVISVPFALLAEAHYRWAWLPAWALWIVAALILSYSISLDIRGYRKSR